MHRLRDVAGGEVGRAEEGDDRLNFARLVGRPAVAFEAVVLVHRAKHHRQVGTRGEADGADVVGVEAIFVGIGAEEADGALHVVRPARGTVLGARR